MFGFVLWLLYGVSVLITLEDFIAKNPAGKRLVEGVKEGSVRLMEWMASNDAKESLKGLPKFLGWTIGVLIFSIWAVGGKLPREITNVLVVVFVGAVFVWTSFNWFLNFKKQIKESVLPLLLVTSTPWFVLLLEKYGEIPDGIALYARVVPLFSSWGFGYLNEYVFAAFLSGAMLLFMSVSLLIAALLFLVVPVLMFLALVLASKISRYFLDNKPTWVLSLFIAYYFFMTMYLAIGLI